MSDTLRLALCQVNPTVGALEANRKLIETALADAFDGGATLAVLPELALCGYPPEDLLLNAAFVDACEETLAGLAETVDRGVALVGTVEAESGRLYNSVAVLANGRVHGFARKARLPNYGVFDEQRYFEPASSGTVIEVSGMTIGVSVCEDIWFPAGPCAEAAASGARLLVNCSASPFHAGKGAERLEMLRARALEHALPIAWCGLVGGQDELVFDGQSMVVDADGVVLARGKQFEPGTLLVDIPVADPGTPSQPVLAPVASIAIEGSGERPPAGGSAPSLHPVLGPVSEIEAALQMGIRDYVEKNSFPGVVLGVSGGIDSAVVAALAADALGPDRVVGVVMPSPWSSAETQDDARRLCSNLGIGWHEIVIEPAMAAFDRMLEGIERGAGFSLSQENIQARIRGNLLMALSNRLGSLVLTTGNKSELAVGYSTLYGDAAGGFGPLKDVPKTTVYELAALRNSRPDAPIPDAILSRAPSAELRPGQRDEDSLPPYPVLDGILRLYVEERLDSSSIAAQGYEAATVEAVLGLVDRAEYKRRQYPPGVKISRLAFGRDRRMPMTNGWRP